MSSPSLATTFAGYSPGWGTPPEWWDWVARTFYRAGFGDRAIGCFRQDIFDPCPGTWAPDQTSGLEIEWREPCYVNHPGDRSGQAKHRWWAKFIQMIQQPAAAAIWCAFSNEQFRSLRPRPLTEIGHGWMVIPSIRVDYTDLATGKPGGAPGRWSWFYSTVEPAETPVDCEILRLS